jgi:glutathione synthase
VKIGFVVNAVATEHAEYTTTRLAFAASRRGHETWLMGVGDLTQEPDGPVTAHAVAAAPKRHRSAAGYLTSLQAPDAMVERMCLDDLDVLMLRNDPADDQVERPWAVTSAVLFAQLAAARGTLVVNDPTSLANAVNKTYFQHFPEPVRPRTLISRDTTDIAAFIDSMGGRAVLKPLQGSGGAGVFFVSGEESPNVNQMIEALARDGYIVAQEVLPGAEQGDVRMFLLNGEPLVADGRYAAFRRMNTTADRRSNISAGGQVRPAKVTQGMLDLAAAVRPKLKEDGMFLVGLDIVGAKLMEVNVFSPGGLGSCEKLYDTRFADVVIDALEDKIHIRRHYGNGLANARLATL